MTLWAHAVSTLVMVGVIWFVQVVHYPLFALIPAKAYRAYQESHLARTGWVVGPPMLLEAGTASALFLMSEELEADWLVWVSFLLLILVWGLTAVFSVPAHGRLAQGFDANVHRRLVATNWLRTFAWTGRGICSVWLLISL